MKLSRSRSSKRGRIEIIPMIDVMFFLLATFMLTSLTMQRLDTVRLDLPQGTAQPLAGPQPLTLTVERDGVIRLNREPVQMNAVAAAVKRMIGTDGNLIIAADSGASHGVVVQAMLQAKRGGAEHFLIAVDRDQ